MDKKTFFHSTPRDINIYLDAYAKRRKDENDTLEYGAWLHGIYVMQAIASCFDKHYDYPDNPLLPKKGDIHDIAEKNGVDETELARELLVMQLLTQDANHKLAKLDEELESMT